MGKKKEEKKGKQRKKEKKEKALVFLRFQRKSVNFNYYFVGMASCRISTKDQIVTKFLSVHIPSLHPPSSPDLEVAPSVQTAAVIGIGMLYLGTANRRIAEVFYLLSFFFCFLFSVSVLLHNCFSLVFFCL